VALRYWQSLRDAATTTPADSAPWTPRETLTGALLTLIPLMSISLLNQASTPTGSLAQVPDSTYAVETLISIVILEGAFAMAPIFYARKHANSAWRQALGFRVPYVALALGLAFLGMLATIILDEIYGIIITALHLSIQTNADRLEQQLGHMPLTLSATLIGAIFIAPICEELFFRSFLLQGLRQVVPTAWAVVLSSVIFAIAHVDLGSLPLLLVLGLMLGTLRVTTRSIWPSIALHMFNNLWTAIFLIMQLHQ
jgi:membrane protease YdiL (CAAX protease family)